MTALVAGDPRLVAQLSVVVTRSEDGATIFTGPVTRLRSLDLGRCGTRQQQKLLLSVTPASTGTDARDDAVQGRGASVGFIWTATQA